LMSVQPTRTPPAVQYGKVTHPREQMAPGQKEDKKNSNEST